VTEMPPLDPIRSRRVSAGDIAYDTLKRAVLDGRLAAGEPLIEERLAEQLQLSRTPLREALRLLEGDELIVRQSNGRLLVAPLSVRQVQELFAVRALLEGLVARQATENITSEGLLLLGKITEAIEQSVAVGELEAVSLHGEAFHAQLYQLSGNGYATRLLMQLRDQIRRYRRIGPVEDPERARQAAREHRLMFELIAAGNAGMVEIAMRSHIEASLASAIRSVTRLLSRQEASQ
jgi:DNA-binding GntR family transcriptional regulator